jgi:hypothetical protein
MNAAYTFSISKILLNPTKILLILILKRESPINSLVELIGFF